MSLMNKMLKVKTSAPVTLLSNSMGNKDCIPTKLPVLNIAFSGKLDGGLVSGITVFAGASKSFKTLLALYCMKAYLDKYPESIAIVYDSEFGITDAYWKSMGIDTERVLHIPIEHVEQLKFDIVKRLNEVKKGDKIFFMIDSLGALASAKEVEDAINEKSVADMTRAKAIRSLLRMITPHFSMKDIPCVIINHVYQTMELYSKAVVGGGTAVMYSANQIFIISKSQETEGSKDRKVLVGWNFTINVEKSRFVRERSRLTFTVHNEKGIKPWSGLFDLAIEGSFLVSPTQGSYSIVDQDTGVISDKKFRAKDTESWDFWEPILASPKFQAYIEDRFLVSANNLVESSHVEDSDDSAAD